MENGKTPTTTTAVPEVVYLDVQNIRMSPQAMRLLTKATGRSMTQLMESPEDADKFQAMAFFEVRRRHPELSAEQLWELAGEVEVELGAVTPDPFGTASSTGSPASPTTGDSSPTPSTT